MTKAMIEVKDLRKTYRIGFLLKPVEALRGVTFTVGQGELYGFIGPNGSGKSTTIKILLGLLRPGSGEAQLMGKPAGSAAGRREVGFLPEQPYFYDYLTGREFLDFYGRLGGLGRADARRRAGETAELVTPAGGTNWLDRKLRTYSKGMLQRIGIAQALLGRPRLLILDEPMSGLDPMGRRDVRTLLQRLHAEGTTVFYSSHVLSDVESMCTRLAMVVGGEIRRAGTVDEVLAGEEESYHVALADPAPGDMPAGLGKPGERAFTCRDRAAKDAFLAWAAGRGVSVESVQRSRHSLEEVLAKEVGAA